MAFKYIKRYQVNGKWRYVYADKNTHNDIRRSELHGIANRTYGEHLKRVALERVEADIDQDPHRSTRVAIANYRQNALPAAKERRNYERLVAQNEAGKKTKRKVKVAVDNVKSSMAKKKTEKIAKKLAKKTVKDLKKSVKNVKRTDKFFADSGIHVSYSTVKIKQ